MNATVEHFKFRIVRTQWNFINCWRESQHDIRRALYYALNSKDKVDPHIENMTLSYISESAKIIVQGMIGSRCISEKGTRKTENSNVVRSSPYSQFRRDTKTQERRKYLHGCQVSKHDLVELNFSFKNLNDEEISWKSNIWKRTS